MSEYTRCPICRKYDDIDRHECLPKWEGCVLEYDETYWFTVYERDAVSAAQGVAELYDCDHELVGAGDIEIVIRRYGSAETKTFLCSAEPIIDYHVVEKGE